MTPLSPSESSYRVDENYKKHKCFLKNSLILNIKWILSEVSKSENNQNILMLHKEPNPSKFMYLLYEATVFQKCFFLKTILASCNASSGLKLQYISLVWTKIWNEI